MFTFLPFYFPMHQDSSSWMVDWSWSLPVKKQFSCDITRVKLCPNININPFNRIEMNGAYIILCMVIVVIQRRHSFICRPDPGNHLLYLAEKPASRMPISCFHLATCLKGRKCNAIVPPHQLARSFSAIASMTGWECEA